MARARTQPPAAATEENDRKPARRVVLRRVRVIEIPAEVDGKTHEEAAAILAKQLRRGTLEAWVECGEFEGSKVGAIEAHAGKPGTPDAKVGVFKAPTVSAFKGGAAYVQPALPKIERTLVD